MTEFVALRRDGTTWDPMFLDAIDDAVCIGCGRCFKVCKHDVLAMKGIDEDGEMVDAGDDDAERMVMTVFDKGKCVGCYACHQVCGSKAMVFITAQQAFAA